ncbi:MAG: cell division protein ZapE [Gammaproteobacteria bacterium]|nr:cell division protein ZapE [Gammaproteobacteria bacterium]
MTITNYYLSHTLNNFVEDQAQLDVVEKLQCIQNGLIQEQKLRNIFPILRKRKYVPGLYLWGHVGSGKTFLMDCFYQSLPLTNKMRMHFFQFMQFIHVELNNYPHQSDPLALIVKQLAKKNIVLCLDEFLVKDIVDAMLLARLLKLMIKEGICLITTANIPPDELYKRGLQRQQFLPAIDLLKKHTEVIHIKVAQDYRTLTASHTVQLTESKMEQAFSILTQGKSISNTSLIINHHSIFVKKRTEDIVWFDFREICCIGRTPADYLFIAKNFPMIFISDIPAISSEQRNLIRLFISMIDVFYDANINLFFSTPIPLADIYVEGDMQFEFKRTLSRLIHFRHQHSN